MKHFILRRKFEILIILFIIIIGVFFFYYVVAKVSLTTNESRQQDIVKIADSLLEYKNFNGQFPVNLDFNESSVQVIAKGVGECDNTCEQLTNVSSCVDLSSELMPTFINEIPFDNTIEAGNNSGYYINRIQNNKILVGVCNADNGDFITVMK